MKSKILSAHQPAFMPWLGYLHRISISDNFIILDDVQFEKNSFTNISNILCFMGVLETFRKVRFVKKYFFEKSGFWNSTFGEKAVSGKVLLVKKQFF